MTQCPKCGGPLTPLPKSMHYRGRYFAGLHCPHDNALWDNPNDSLFAYVASLGPTDTPDKAPLSSLPPSV